MAATTQGAKRRSKKSARSRGRATSGTTESMRKAVEGAMDKSKEAAQGLKEKMSSMMPSVGRLFSRNIELEFESLRDLYKKELQDLYSAEHQLLKALPKMAEAASSQGLRTAFQEHLRETEGQVTRLEEIFDRLGMDVKASHCKAMEGLVA